MRYTAGLIALLCGSAIANSEPLKDGDYLQRDMRMVCFGVNQTLKNFLDFKQKIETAPINYARLHPLHVQVVEISPVMGCEPYATEGYILKTLLQREVRNPTGMLVRISIFKIWPLEAMNGNNYATINVVEGEFLTETAH